MQQTKPKSRKTIRRVLYLYNCIELNVKARELQGQVRHYGCPQSAFKQDCSSIRVPEVLEFCPENCDRERHHSRIAD